MLSTLTNEFKELTADEAAEFVKNGMTLGFSGFTPAGACKAIPKAIGRRARDEHDSGRPFKIGVITGASTGDSLDGELARSNAISWRTPYQSDKYLRQSINRGETRFFDMHLSQLPQHVRYGFLGDIDIAVVEASDLLPDGRIVLTTSVGASPTFCSCAKKILVELNSYHPKELRGLHDIYEPRDPPDRGPIPILSPRDRIGHGSIKVDPSKIIGYVRTNLPDEINGFKDSDPITDQIGENVATFLASELRAGRIPAEFLPIQSGVGNIANAVLRAIGNNPDIPPFQMYSEVIQDSVIGLMKSGDITFASATSLTLSGDILSEVYQNLDYFKYRIMLRPQEISNHPEVIRRIGVISINTAIEADIFGNVNSTHVMGKDLMNGIGGSGDFTRNSFISIFTCPSVAKGGKISAIVPLVSHMDHSEHSVQVLITEQGIADLRGKSPSERSEAIIENCVHPDYRDDLLAYREKVSDGHTRQSLSSAFFMHQRFLESGDMRATVTT